MPNSRKSPDKAPKVDQRRVKYGVCTECESSIPIGADGKLVRHMTRRPPTWEHVPCEGKDHE